MEAKAVIIDHEPLMAAQLKKLLQQEKPAIEVKAICYEGEQAMACLAAYQPDIVFLTLEMPRVSGMTIAREIEAAKGPHPAVVFVTGQRDFISQALRLNVLDYLVKPVTEEEVRRVVEKFRAVYIKKEAPLQEGASETDVDRSSRPSYARRFSVDEGDKIKLISTEDIRLVYAEKRKVFLVTLSGKTYPSHLSLVQFEKRLPEAVFFRCHRNYIVNIDEVQQIEPWFHHQYVLIVKGMEDQPVPIGRSYVKKLRQYVDL
ncbi:LytR/AlgR family response regulator transcription factor [Megasphaera sp.]|uniref:LytR/AlgR family response regulator transcription factor n=1 Tax=Megasphaera sp. TaxID=2023260 RepID=UPI0026727DA9|nr:LytTR family DNA-binding domain-containing protein [uncultured Megasphaera sp.]